MTESESAIGCGVECEEGYRVTYDGKADGVTYAMCTPEEDVDFECPGAIEYGCPVADPDVFDVNCNCEGEMWIDSTCTKAFLCSGAQLETGENPGKNQMKQNATVEASAHRMVNHKTLIFECVHPLIGYDFECGGDDDLIVDGYLYDGTINCVPRDQGFCREGTPYRYTENLQFN